MKSLIIIICIVSLSFSNDFIDYIKSESTFKWDIEVGYLPKGTFKTYQWNDYQWVDCPVEVYTDLQFDLYFPFIFLGGGSRVNSFQKKFIKHYEPYNTLYQMRAGLHWMGFEFGWNHSCIHPQYVYYSNIPTFHWEGSYDEIYIKYSGEVNISKILKK